MATFDISQFAQAVDSAFFRGKKARRFVQDQGALAFDPANPNVDERNMRTNPYYQDMVRQDLGDRQARATVGFNEGLLDRSKTPTERERFDRQGDQFNVGADQFTRSLAQGADQFAQGQRLTREQLAAGVSERGADRNIAMGQFNQEQAARKAQIENNNTLGLLQWIQVNGLDGLNSIDLASNVDPERMANLGWMGGQGQGQGQGQGMSSDEINAKWGSFLPESSTPTVGAAGASAAGGLVDWFSRSTKMPAEGGRQGPNMFDLGQAGVAPRGATPAAPAPAPAPASPGPWYAPQGPRPRTEPFHPNDEAVRGTTPAELKHKQNVERSAELLRRIFGMGQTEGPLGNQAPSPIQQQPKGTDVLRMLLQGNEPQSVPAMQEMNAGPVQRNPQQPQITPEMLQMIMELLQQGRAQ